MEAFPTNLIIVSVWTVLCVAVQGWGVWGKWRDREKYRERFGRWKAGEEYRWRVERWFDCGAGGRGNR